MGEWGPFSFGEVQVEPGGREQAEIDLGDDPMGNPMNIPLHIIH